VTPYSPSELRRRKMPAIRVSNELKSELDDAKNTLFPFRVSYNDVLSLLPRCPHCNSLLLRLEKDDALQCWKCKKKYRLEEVRQE